MTSVPPLGAVAVTTAVWNCGVDAAAEGQEPMFALTE
jgi:hypothetical protein